MNTCILVALSGFTISVCLSLAYLANVVPWIIAPVKIQATFICLVALYLPLAIGMLIQSYFRQCPCPTTNKRVIFGFLFGMSFGLFMSCGLAIFGDHGLNWFHSAGLDSLLCGGTQKAVWEELRVLLPYAEVLGMLNKFIEFFIPVTFGFGFSAALLVRLIDFARVRIVNQKRI